MNTHKEVDEMFGKIAEKHLKNVKGAVPVPVTKVRRSEIDSKKCEGWNPLVGWRPKHPKCLKE